MKNPSVIVLLTLIVYNRACPEFSVIDFWRLVPPGFVVYPMVFYPRFSVQWTSRLLENPIALHTRDVGTDDIVRWSDDHGIGVVIPCMKSSGGEIK